MAASTARARIQKGKDLENHVCDQIREKGLDPKACRSPGSGNGNREKGDISTSLMVLGQNAGFECKHHDKFSVHEWWKQTKKLESLSREPILVIKQTADNYADTKVVIYLDTFLELVKLSNQAKGIVEVPKENSRKLKWTTEQAIFSLKTLLKSLEQEYE